MIDPGDWLPLAGVMLLGGTTIVGIVGAYAYGKMRGQRDGVCEQMQQGDTHARIERMERSLLAVAEEIERLGEVQRFALKVIGDKALASGEKPPALPQGRVITPH
ncbi:MAG TPA: hypothetical protein VJ867_17120 [Gemmatimonadaceae bacterium]|nr:hypothetical protein [Gemmatimonadaceae bacterium]